MAGPYSVAPVSGILNWASTLLIAGASEIKLSPGIPSKCFLLLETSGILCRMAHDAIQRSLEATTLCDPSAVLHPYFSFP